MALSGGGRDLAEHRRVSRAQVLGLRRGHWGAETSVIWRRGVQLTSQQRGSLERDGYLLVPLLLDETVIARMASRLGELVRGVIVG